MIKESSNGQEQLEDVNPSVVEDIDAEAIFNEAATGETASGESGQPGTPVEPEVKEESKGEAPEKIEEPKEEDDPEKLRQRLSDTQRWGHEQSERVKQLEAENATLKEQRSADKKEEIPEELKRFYEDYPEFRKAVELESKRIFNERFGDTDINQLRSLPQEVQRASAQAAFDVAVLGGYQMDDGAWMDGHPDALRIIADPKFKEWATGKKVDSGKVTDPRDAIRIIGEYKSDMAKASVAAHDVKNTKADQMKQLASGAPPKGSKRSDGESRKAVEDDPEKIFEQFIK